MLCPRRNFACAPRFAKSKTGGAEMIGRTCLDLFLTLWRALLVRRAPQHATAARILVASRPACAFALALDRVYNYHVFIPPASRSIYEGFNEVIELGERVQDRTSISRLRNKCVPESCAVEHAPGSLVQGSRIRHTPVLRALPLDRALFHHGTPEIRVVDARGM